MLSSSPGCTGTATLADNQPSAVHANSSLRLGDVKSYSDRVNSSSFVVLFYDFSGFVVTPLIDVLTFTN